MVFKLAFKQGCTLTVVITGYRHQTVRLVSIVIEIVRTVGRQAQISANHYRNWGNEFAMGKRLNESGRDLKSERVFDTSGNGYWRSKKRKRRQIRLTREIAAATPNHRPKQGKQGKLISPAVRHRHHLLADAVVRDIKDHFGFDHHGDPLHNPPILPHRISA